MNSFKQNLWENYGFQDNPFDTAALSTQVDSALSIKKAFILREKDCQASRLVNNILRSTGGARFVLEGELGVGKTTFINYYKYLWEREVEDQLFVPASELSFSPSWTVKEFLLNLLSVITIKVLLIKGEDFVNGHPLFKELMILNKVYNFDNYQIEGSIFGWGGGYSRSQEISLPTVPEAQLFHYYRQAVSSIREWGYKGIILHFDNLEMTNKGSVKQSQNIFDEIRDILQVRHVYYIFVSQPGFFQQVIVPLPRVRSIFWGWPINLRPLSKEETLQAFHRRYELLALRDVKYILPVEDRYIEYLYDIYEGQIRFIMDAINAIILHTQSRIPRTLKKEEAQPLLKIIVSEKMRQNLTQNEWDILSWGVRFDRFTNAGITEALKMKRQNVNKYLQSLTQKNYIRFIEKEGRNVYYKVVEDAKILKIFAEKQKTLPSKIEKKQESSLNKRQKNFLKNPISPTNFEEYAKKVGVSFSTARRDLKELELAGFVESFKEGRALFYQILKISPDGL